MKRHLLFCLLLTSLGANGALNKWVDADGKVHYSDEPPPSNIKAKTLSAPSPASGTPAAKTVAEREAEWNKARKEQEEAAQKAARQQEETQAKQKYCDELRSSLSTLENAPRIASYNAQGERIILDDAARQKQIEDARNSLENNCK